MSVAHKCSAAWCGTHHWPASPFDGLAAACRRRRRPTLPGRARSRPRRHPQCCRHRRSRCQPCRERGAPQGPGPRPARRARRTRQAAQRWRQSQCRIRRSVVSTQRLGPHTQRPERAPRHWPLLQARAPPAAPAPAPQAATAAAAAAPAGPCRPQGRQPTGGGHYVPRCQHEGAEAGEARAEAVAGRLHVGAPGRCPTACRAAAASPLPCWLGSCPTSAATLASSRPLAACRMASREKGQAHAVRRTVRRTAARRGSRWSPSLSCRCVDGRQLGNLAPPSPWPGP